jgi:hypothetical protein
LTNAQPDRSRKILDYLELHLASDFVEAVSATLRQLTDAEINTLYLTTHTDWHMGETVHAWIAVLLPLIDAEAELRRGIEVVPWLGPVVAPDLYRDGGGHDLPF